MIKQANNINLKTSGQVTEIQIFFFHLKIIQLLVQEKKSYSTFKNGHININHKAIFSFIQSSLKKRKLKKFQLFNKD